MNGQKTTTKVPLILFEDECFPDISITKTTEENNMAIDEAFKKLREQIDKEMKIIDNLMV